MADDIDLDASIDKTVGEFIGEIAPGSEPAPSPDAPLEPAAPATTSLAKPGVPGSVEPIAYPKSWSKDYEPHWGKMPRELQEYVTNTREKDYLDGLEQYKSGHQNWNTIHEVMQPYMPRLTSLGLQPAEAVRALMNADWALSQGTPEQKIGILAQICQNYGIDPSQIRLPGGGEAPFRTEGEQALLKQFHGLHSTVQGFMKSQHETLRAQTDKDVLAFATDPKHPYFDEVANDIALLISADNKVSLADAYEKAVWANPTTRAKEIERLNKDRSETERKAREEAARKARGASAANLRGKQTERTTGAAKGGWEEELLETHAAIKSRT